MPEILEAGFFFPCFILLFITTITLLYPPEYLKVIGLWCDLTKEEHKECTAREEQLLQFASSLSKFALKRGHLAQWANDLEDLADAIPDTHGLLIHSVWEQLHPPIRRQLSPNHSSWASFCAAIRELRDGVEITPQKREIIVPVPWHRQRLPLCVPYKITDRPSTTPLVVKLTARMPRVYRGRDPTKTPVKDDSDSEEDDDDSSDSESEWDQETNDNDAFDADAPEYYTDYTRYYWPKYLFPDIDVSGPIRVIADVGLKLQGLLYDARKTILNLGNAYLEIEPLLHTSPQIYTKEQWEGITRVPNSVRGFKIGLAIEFPSHTLSLNSFDNNFRIHWRSVEEEKVHYRSRAVPDPVYDYPGWCTYTAKWLARRLNNPSKTTTLAVALSKSGKHPFRGLGKYGTNEVMAIAGKFTLLICLFPWMLLHTVLSNPVLFGLLCEAFIEFITPRALQSQAFVQSALRSDPKPPKTDRGIIPDFALSVTGDQKMQYVESLKVHGRKRSHLTEVEADLIDRYNVRPSCSNRDPSTFFSSKRKAAAPSLIAFDLSCVRFAVTQYGHLGALIAGDKWQKVLSELRSSPALLAKQAKEYRQLTRHLDERERIRFKPITLMTEDDQLQAAGFLSWAENPISEYYRKHPSFLNRDKRIDIERLSLTRQPTRWRDPKLISTVNRTGYMWSLFNPPFVVYQPKQATRKSMTAPPPPVKPPLQMYILQSEKTRDEYTIQHIKNETKGFTVGPHDFVGHGEYMNLGRTRSVICSSLSLSSLFNAPSFTGLCFWHESLSEQQMLALHRAREAKSRYPKGMRKMSIANTESEKKWRSPLVSDFKKTHPTASQSAVAKFIRSERKNQRAQVMEDIRALVEEDQGKKGHGRQASPRKASRVKNRSLIKTLAAKWKDM
ncbi:hypothetical protein R3P38DRAFT_2578028 [Favolaschia claudopus]|uniref:Uncharacterized protein n=1 Tax=Favolaschia claudopus TaxID=2862362 RepID=A0AAV9ZHF6_9AGAR